MLEEIGEQCQNADISIEYQDGEQIVLLNGENVNGFLRTEEVGNMASVSSAIPRSKTEHLLNLQRNLAATMSVVMDGRDIGTTILPDAEVKIYLTASSLNKSTDAVIWSYRTERRLPVILNEIQKDIEERDQRDMNQRDLSSETGRGCSACGFFRNDDR